MKRKKLTEENAKLSKQVEAYKNKVSVNAEQQKAGEAMAQVRRYINDDTKTFYIKIPTSVMPVSYTHLTLPTKLEV